MSQGKKHSTVSLKFPAFLPDVGTFKVLRGETLRTASGQTEFRVTSVRIRQKWVEVHDRKLWVQDDCVVAREFYEPLPEARQLNFLGEGTK